LQIGRDGLGHLQIFGWVRLLELLYEYSAPARKGDRLLLSCSAASGAAVTLLILLLMLLVLVGLVLPSSEQMRAACKYLTGAKGD
jgi:hypothetical protein